MGTDAAARQWGEDLRAWAIPDEIVAAAGRSPWGHPVARFAARADADLAEPSGVSFEAAGQALRDVAPGAPGTVLDVGAGAGAASLPLGPWASSVTAVDPSRSMLDAFESRASAHGVPAVTVEGRWPDACARVEPHDVVVCHHVAYDVADIGPFLAALTEASRRRVVLEVTEQHPMAWLSPLWLRFHGLVRPHRPVADDLVGVLHESGVAALTVEHWDRDDRATLAEADRVALVTRRLCLPAEREPEVREAMHELGLTSPRRLVTIAWAGRASGGNLSG